MTLTNVTLHVEIAFSAGPYDLSPTWTDVTPYVRHVATKRGRNNEFNQIEAGTCTLTLDNADGRFTPARTISPDPYKGNILPRKQMRVRAVVNSTSKPIFKGYTERWSLTHPGGGDYSEAVCECTDAFKILSTTKVLDFYGENVQRLNPAAYYPLSEPAGTVLFGDHSGRGLPAGVLWKRTTNDQSSAGADVLVGATPSVSFDPGGDAGGADIDLTAAMPAFPFRTDNWSSSFWFKLGSNYYPGGRSNPPLPGPGPSPPSPIVPNPPVGPGGNGSAPIVTPGPNSPGSLTGLGTGGGNPGTGQVTWDTSGSGGVQYDLFDRADTTGSLGVATNGQTWSQTGTGLKISGNRGAAAASGDQGLLEIATVDQDFKMDFSGQSGHFNILFQADDSNNFFAVQHWPSDGHTTLGVMVSNVWTLFDEKDIQAKSSATWQITYTSGSNGIQVHRDGEAVFSYVLDAVAYAKTLLGKPYDANQWLEAPGTTGVGIGPASYTCCGLTAVAYGRLGVDLPPYNVTDQYNATSAVTGTPQAGDLAFFHWNVAGNPDAWNHVGLLSDSSGALINADSDKMIVCTTTVDETLAKQPGSTVAYRRPTVGYSVSPTRTKAGFGIGSDGGSINVTVDNFVSASASGVDNYRITPDNGTTPIEITPAQIAAGGFPSIPITNGACNSVTVQAHNSAGWSAPSLPSACTTNTDSVDIYDTFTRADSTSGFGTSSSGAPWGAVYTGGIKEGAGYACDYIAWETLFLGRNQDFLIDIHGSDVADANGTYWIYFNYRDEFYRYLRVTRNAGAYGLPSSFDIGNGSSAPSYTYFKNYSPLDYYDQYHIQYYNAASGLDHVMIACNGEILFSERIPAQTDPDRNRAGVALSGGPYPWGNNHQRVAAFIKGNPKKVRGMRAYPLAGGAEFYCDPPTSAGSGVGWTYRVKVGGQTVTGATMPITVTGLTDFTECTYTMSAKPPGSGSWGPDAETGKVTPGWSAAPTISSAVRHGSDIWVDYTLGDAHSRDYNAVQIHAMSDQLAYWDFNPPYAHPLVLTGASSASRVKIWVDGTWNGNTCNTHSAWKTVT